MKYISLVALIFIFVSSVQAQSTSATFNKIRAIDQLQIGASDSHKATGIDTTVTLSNSKLTTSWAVRKYVNANSILIGSSAGGDLNGTYPNPNVIALQGRPISATAPSMGEVLKWSGSQWVPDTDHPRAIS